MSDASVLMLSEHQVPLGLFAEAISGQPVALRAVDDILECWPWKLEGVETDEVVLPTIAAERSTWRSLVLMQLLLDPSGLAPGSQPLERWAYWLAEHRRVRAQVQFWYPGAIGQIQALHARMLSAGVAGHWHQLHPVLGVAGQLALGTPQAQVDSKFATDVAALLVPLADPGATVHDTTDASSKLVALMRLPAGHRWRDLLEEAEAEDAPPVSSDEASGASVDGGSPDSFEQQDGLGGGHFASDTLEHQVTADASSDAPPRAGLQLPPMPSRRLGDQRTFLYDEWDYHQSRWRTAWCRVVEEQLSGDDPGFLDDVRARHQQLRTEIRRRLAELRPQGLRRVYRCDDGDELDIDAAIEAMCDLRSGVAPDERVQMRRDRIERDVASLFLVDLSASTSAPVLEPEPADPALFDPEDDPMSYGPLWGAPPKPEPVRRIIDVAKEAVALMGDALHEIGDQFAIYGFSGTGREHVDVKVSKDFSDRVSAATWSSVGAMRPLRYTRMGPAVRHSVARLVAQQARTRLLFIVSDGYPQDIDYGIDRHDREYGIQDTARAIADAQDIGVDVFCITIDPAGHEYLREMCPPGRYLVLDDIESLPAELAGLYLGLRTTV